MFPTVSFSSTSGTVEGATSPVSSLSPRSLARWRRHMKQKLVLISASLSSGYERCNPTITSSNVRASSGLVTASRSASYQAKESKKKFWKHIPWTFSHHHLRVLGMLLRTRDLETLPNILLQLPDVHTLRTFGIIDKFRADASCLTLRLRE